MILLEGRTLSQGQKVQVYYNQHKGGYSIRDKKSHLVVAYAHSVFLKNCTFKVSQK
ncbi:hypothetical protein [Metabacillus sp. 84]|uniref:hypothetical protein n=1 Tax=Metabacillus sp. 84 TaxID=3404705 RepID=UPI003CF56FC7